MYNPIASSPQPYSGCMVKFNVVLSSVSRVWEKLMLLG